MDFCERYQFLIGFSLDSQYSGSPGDYLHKFVGVVEIFRQWPSAGVIWAKDIVKKKGVEDGIAEITKALVDDQMNYQKTKNVQTDEKKAIVDFLLSSEKYISVARKHFEKLA